MANRNIILSKTAVDEKNGVVVLPLKKWQKMEKEKLELRGAIKAILSGELSLRKGKTRSFKDFIKDKYAQDF
ncbi:MAG: hypothetical protein AAB361_01585 [Patescibacteria group bacterium]